MLEPYGTEHVKTDKLRLLITSISYIRRPSSLRNSRQNTQMLISFDVMHLQLVEASVPTFEYRLERGEICQEGLLKRAKANVRALRALSELHTYA